MMTSGKSSRIWRQLESIRAPIAVSGTYLRNWVRLPVLLISVILGVIAWSLVAFSFVLLLHNLEIELSFNMGFSAYPVSMLAGAATMLPGGVGATEAGLTFILTQHGIEVAQAIGAAIAIRLLTLWSAMLVGTVCLVYLELELTQSLG
jgi:uncharacterized protein (TIRG00374 family)